MLSLTSLHEKADRDKNAFVTGTYNLWQQYLIIQSHLLRRHWFC